MRQETALVLGNSVGDPLTYLCQPRHWANNIVPMAPNDKVFDLYFILNRAILLKWKPDFIMNGLNILCIKMEHLLNFNSLCFLPCALRNLPEAFGLEATISW